MSRTIVVGETKFRDTVMDYNPIFRVVEDMKNGTYKCISEDEDGYGGVVRYFDKPQILAKVRWEGDLDRMISDADRFWETRAVGEVLHYNNGFDNFVRGRVVLHEGKKKLQPFALCGKWAAHDLPKRRPNGEIYYPYNADKIVNGDKDSSWQPSPGCVFESPTYSYGTRSNVDPRDLNAIDLTVPDMTFEEQEQAELEQAIDRVRKILEDRYQTSASAKKVLDDIVAVATFQA